MPHLQHFAADTPVEVLMATLDLDGALILDNAISPEATQALRDELQPYVDATKPGQDGFTGYKTTRTGALVARSPLCHPLIQDPRILEIGRAHV